MDFKEFSLKLLFKTIALIFDIILFPIHLLVQHPLKYWLKAWRSRSTRKLVETKYGLRHEFERSWDPIDPPSQFNSCKTFDEMSRLAIKLHASKPCLGHRPLISQTMTKLPDGREMQLKNLSNEYEWLTYEEVDVRINSIIKALTNSGIKPKDKVALILETSKEWTLIAHSVLRMGATLCTMYSTLGIDGIISGLNQIESSHIICNQESVQKFITNRGKIPNVKHLITINHDLKKPDDSNNNESIKVTPLEELISTSTHLSLPTYKPDSSDLALIMFTSGTTGDPKGVMFNQKQFVSAFLSIDPVLRTIYFGKNATFLAFLPAAHIFEFMLELICINFGIAIAYSSPTTAFDFSPGLHPGVKGDVSICHPTFMIAVPLILDRLATGIKAKIKEKGLLVQTLFKFAVDYKIFWSKYGFNCPLINRTLFKQTKLMIGGYMETIVFGSAPFSPDTQKFIQAVLDVKLLQAYGTTETLGIGTMTDPYAYSTQYGYSGSIEENVKICLDEWVEGGYYPADKPSARGEIWVGCDSISLGYYKNIDKTNESFFIDDDGTRWFKSSDIGLIHERYGTIKIIDRKSDLVKLPNGEYVSLGKIESFLKRNPFIENICVCHRTGSNYLAAIILPNRVNLIKLIEEINSSNDIPLILNEGGPSTDSESKFSDATVVSKVIESIQISGHEAGLKLIEIPTKIFITTDEWTPANGLVTASLKLRRKQVVDHYKDTIDLLFNK